jgi:2-keto-4-pentenoate hydratase
VKPQDPINSMDSALVETLACRLREAQSTRAPIAPIRDELAALGVAGAYAVQLANTRHGLRHGRRLAGRKIGLTARSVQAQLGVDQPDYGMLFADMALCDGDDVAPNAVLQPKVEAEVAFMMGRDVVHADATPAEVMAAVEFALPAIEIVGSRIEAWNIKLLDTVADNAPVRHGHGARRRRSQRRQRRGLPGPSVERGGLAGPKDGRGRTAAAGG